MFRLFSGSKAKTQVEVRSGRRSSCLRAALILLAGSGVPAFATVFYYHPTIFFPEQFGWERIVGGAPERRLEDGWLIQTFQESGQDFYRFDIGGHPRFVGRFFVEWRAMTDNPEWLIDEFQVPAVVAAGGMARSLYHVVMTESAAVLLRDVSIPRVIVPISIGEPHTYRVEVYSDEYVWYIDGVVVDSGVPEGPYPDPDAQVVWGAEVTHDDAPPATTAWDYVRFGEIPKDASGNYNSDFGEGPKGLVDRVMLDDYRFFVECLTNDGPDLFGGPENNAGPGCRFADFDFDDDIDLFDFAEFANHFTGFLP